MANRRVSVGDAMAGFLSGHFGGGSMARMPTPLLEGKLCKKSDWLGKWDVRDFAVHPACGKTSSPARLSWSGGRQEGSITLYVYTDVSVETRHEEGDRLLVRSRALDGLGRVSREV